jgi:hypothetical protein
MKLYFIEAENYDKAINSRLTQRLLSYIVSFITCCLLLRTKLSFACHAKVILFNNIFRHVFIKTSKPFQGAVNSPVAAGQFNVGGYRRVHAD